MSEENKNNGEMPATKPEAKSPNQAVQELIAFLTPLAEGQLIPDFNNHLHDLVKAVRETRKTILKTFREICGKISKEVSLSVHYTE